MGLFSKKKKEEKEELPPLRFPESPKVPYEPQIMPSEARAIKKAITPSPRIELPIKKPVTPMIEFPTPVPRKEGKTLFVKIDNYKRAMKTMADIKEKLYEIESILKKLENLKQEEDDQLTGWHNSLDDIKSKLLEIDKALFEESL